MPPRRPREGGNRDRRASLSWDDFVLPLPKQTANRIDKRPAKGANIGLWLDKLTCRSRAAFELEATHRAFSLRQLGGAHQSEAAAAAIRRAIETAKTVHGEALMRVFRAEVDGRLLIGYGRTSTTEATLTFHRL